MIFINGLFHFIATHMPTVMQSAVVRALLELDKVGLSTSRRCWENRHCHDIVSPYPELLRIKPESPFTWSYGGDQPLSRRIPERLAFAPPQGRLGWARLSL